MMKNVDDNENALSLSSTLSSSLNEENDLICSNSQDQQKSIHSWEKLFTRFSIPIINMRMFHPIIWLELGRRPAKHLHHNYLGSSALPNLVHICISSFVILVYICILIVFVIVFLSHCHTCICILIVFVIVFLSHLLQN